LVTARGLSAVLGAISSIKAAFDKPKQPPSSTLVNAITILVQRVFEVAMKESSSMDIKSWLLLTSVVGFTTNPMECYAKLATAVNHIATSLKEKKTSGLSWSDRDKDYIIDLLMPVHDAIENEVGNSTKEGLMRDIKAGLLDSMNQIEAAKNYAMPNEAEIARKQGFADVQKFLASPTETTLELNLSKSGRMAVHRLIDNHMGYDKVRHSSSGFGRDRYLVLTKKDADTPSVTKAKKGTEGKAHGTTCEVEHVQQIYSNVTSSGD